MSQNKTVYKAVKSYYMISGLVYFIIIFFFLTLPAIIAGTTLEKGKMIGLIGFWAMGILLVVIQMSMRIEIEGNEVRSYVLGLRVLKLRSSEVKNISYGNLMKGGLGFGKGLIIRATINGRNKSLTIGERLYGKKAIENIRSLFNSL